MPVRKVWELVPVLGMSPLVYRRLQPPCYFSLCKTFSLLFLKLFCPFSLLPVHVSYSQEKCWWKNKFSRSYYNNKWMSVNSGRYRLSKGQQEDYCEGNIYHKIEQKYPLRWFLTHFSNFLENRNLESNLTP